MITSGLYRIVERCTGGGKHVFVVQEQMRFLMFEWWEDVPYYGVSDTPKTHSSIEGAREQKRHLEEKRDWEERVVG